MRAIMNNKYGFNLVMEHNNAINCIALSLNHHSFRTKSLVLELLAAICLVKGGHQIILSAFDNFKDVMSENRRFQTLMNYFTNYESFNIEFMITCMQFINITVHSVEDMNFRVYLQFEFTQLGLDDYLENKLRSNESEDLQVQIQAYLDNVFDVGVLMEDAEQKNTALDYAQQLAQKLSHAHEIEKEWETRHQEMRQDYESAIEINRQLEEQLNNLKRSISAREEESKKRQTLLESKIQQLEIKSNQTSANHSDLNKNGQAITIISTATSPIKSLSETQVQSVSPASLSSQPVGLMTAVTSAAPSNLSPPPPPPLIILQRTRRRSKHEA